MKIKVHGKITPNEELTAWSKAMMKNKRKRKPNIHSSFPLETLHQDPHSILAKIVSLNLSSLETEYSHIMTLQWFDCCN